MIPAVQTQAAGPEDALPPARTEAGEALDLAAMGLHPPPADPPLAEDKVPYLPRGVRLAEDKVRGLMILQAPERALQLDAIGAAILSAVDGRHPLATILDDLAARYGAPRAQIAADVTGFLQGLIDRRMVFVRLP